MIISRDHLQLCRSRLERRLHRLGDELRDGLHAQERDAEQIMRDAAEVNDIVLALERIRRGEYGKCVCCGEPLPWARLSALPQAARCLRCEEALETRQPRPASL